MRDRASSTYEDVAKARKSFNEYFETVVTPLLGLSKPELERLNFTETAERIVDVNIRGEYRDRAVKLLGANISFYGQNADPIDAPERNTAFPVASTLLVSALAYKFGSGTFPTLVAAAAWYWLVAEYEARRRKGAESAAREHNAGVAEWVKTIEDWRTDQTSLELLD